MDEYGTVQQGHHALGGHRPRNRRVLLIENDPDLQWRLARMLTVDGNRVVGTSSGDGALALIDHWPVDLVLVAEALPGIDGLEVARELRDRIPETPVILMAEQRSDVQVAARHAGAVACLIKPFRFEALRSLIDSLFDSVQLASAPAE